MSPASNIPQFPETVSSISTSQWPSVSSCPPSMHSCRKCKKSCLTTKQKPVLVLLRLLALSLELISKKKKKTKKKVPTFLHTNFKQLWSRFKVSDGGTPLRRQVHLSIYFRDTLCQWIGNFLKSQFHFPKSGAHFWSTGKLVSRAGHCWKRKECVYLAGELRVVWVTSLGAVRGSRSLDLSATCAPTTLQMAVMLLIHGCTREGVI